MMPRLLSKKPVTADHTFICGDCLDILKGMPDDSVDLVVTSPPYEDARLYGELNFKVKGQDWVDWAKARYLECCRVSRGLVAWVVEGKTRNFQWSATPALLMADLHRAGVRLRKPPLYVRHGIPGSGGPDWLKNRYEFIICSSKGKLLWSDNTAMGHPPIYGKGGQMSNRDQAGERRTFSIQTRRETNGQRQVALDTDRGRPLPELANPGNLIDCGADTHFGWGNESEAPFPEKVPEFFIRSFCPPGGTVLDPFVGSGTSVCVAKRLGRKGIGIDIRQDQIELSLRRIADPIYTPENV